jgi:putative membrane protein
MHWWNGDGLMGRMGIWWIVGAALIAVIVWTVLRLSRKPMNGSSESPEKVLKRRYAKGEIDHETYQRTLTELRG